MVTLEESGRCPCCGASVIFIGNDRTFAGTPHMCHPFVSVSVTGTNPPPEKSPSKNTFIGNHIKKQYKKWQQKGI